MSTIAPPDPAVALRPTRPAAAEGRGHRVLRGRPEDPAWVRPAPVSALKVGDTIQVNGTTANDGSITAATIRSGDVGPRR